MLFFIWAIITLAIMRTLFYSFNGVREANVYYDKGMIAHFIGIIIGTICGSFIEACTLYFAIKYIIQTF